MEETARTGKSDYQLAVHDPEQSAADGVWLTRVGE
jgi:hypothetical protein